jgi:hypothetical protein
MPLPRGWPDGLWIVNFPELPEFAVLRKLMGDKREGIMHSSNNPFEV